MAGRSSPDEAAAKLTALHDRLVQEVAALVSGDDWQRWLDVAKRFPTYSFNNCLLIAAQRPDATAVAGYQAWQTMHRQVNRGERGLQILAPVTRRAAADDDDDTKQVRRVTGFRVTHVWDVTQTTGEPLPEPPSPSLLKGQAPEGLWDSLSRFVQSRGFEVERGDCGEANGWTDHLARKVRVRNDIDPAQAVKTLAHEAAHVLLHGPITVGPRSTREQAEVEAESVAYLVTSIHGLSSDGYSFAYVASWASHATGDAEAAVREAGQRVLGAARDILKVTGGLVPPEVSPALSARVTAGAARSSGSRQVAANAADAADAEVSANRLAAVNRASCAFFSGALADSQTAGNLLAERGISAQSIDVYQLGYAPAGWTSLTDHLRGLGFTDAELSASGVAAKSRRGTLIDRFRERLMFPVPQPDGSHIAGFIGRALQVDERAPKYLNTPQTALYSKSNLLYGLGFEQQNAQLESGAVPVLVEGPLDAIAVTQASGGRFVGLAPSGTALTGGQMGALDDIARLAGRQVIVAFDGDQAGQQAAARSYHLLRQTGAAGLVVRLPPGEDPASLALNDPRRLTSAISTPEPLADVLIDHRIDRWSDHLRWVEGRLGAMRSCASVIVTLDERDVGRQVTRVAERLGFDPTDVTRELLSAADNGVLLRERQQSVAAVSVTFGRSSSALPDPHTMPAARPQPAVPVHRPRCA